MKREDSHEEHRSPWPEADPPASQFFERERRIAHDLLQEGERELGRGVRQRANVSSLSPHEWPRFVRRVLTEAARDRITTIAGSLAFHGFLALLPFLVALVALLGIIGLSPDVLHRLLHDVGVLLPSQMSQVVTQELSKPPSRGVSVAELITGIIIAFWSSIEAMCALQIALDVAYEVPHDRGFVRRRIVALPLVAFTFVLGGAASVLIVLGQPLQNLFPHSLAALKPEYHWLVVIIQFGGALLLVMLLLSAYYRFGTAAGQGRWEWISPGSVIAAIGWAIMAAGFAFYLNHFGHEARNYGALADVAVTLLWMFLTGVCILLGAEVNRELERVDDRRQTGAQQLVS